ncbi:DUF6709 family protein [Clostridium lundense]|uniref:DUF6709 family protein n=1 Tax=Clostridium lundense TaxID=319475 RepID=UPI000482CEF1|nr:DUF6709 family protein [Clostridium lundense]
MKQSYFMKAYKKRWRYRIIAMMFCALVTLGFIGIGIETYYDNTNNATVVKNLEDYKKALNNESYIQISSDKLYDLDIVETETRSKLGIKISEDVKARFIAIELDPFILPVALPNKEYKELMAQKKGPYILKGTLIEFEDSELAVIKDAVNRNKAVFKLTEAQPYLQYLKYESPINSALVYFVCAGLCVIFVLTLYIIAMRKNTLALKSLKNFSNGDIEFACAQIDNELSLSNVYKNGPIIITNNYIIVETQQIVFALPLRELMWVYKQTVKKKAYGIIPAGKTNSIVFVFSDKHTYQVDLFRGEKIIDEVIEYMYNNCKTSFVGYSEDLKNLLKKDYDEFMHKWRIHKENSKNMSM